MATLEAGTTPRSSCQLGPSHWMNQSTYLTQYTYLETSNHRGGMGRGENLQRFTKIQSKWAVTISWQNSICNAMWHNSPANLPKGRPTMHDVGLKIKSLGLNFLLRGGLSHVALTIWAVATWRRMGRRERRSTKNVLFLTFSIPLGSLCKGERGLNMAGHLSLWMLVCIQKCNCVLMNLWGSIESVVRTKLRSQFRGLTAHDFRVLWVSRFLLTLQRAIHPL